MTMITSASRDTVGELRDSSDALDDGAELRARGERDGYLFFRGLLPAADVLPVRRDLMGRLDAHGWLAEGHPVEAGIMDDAAINRVPEEDLRVDIGVSIEGYVDVQRSQLMHQLPHHPRLLGLYRTLFGEEVFVHPRHIVRVMTSHRALHPTPPHQDFPLIQGTGRTWTAWFPLGDCPKDMGSLTVLRGSHTRGYLPIEMANGAGGIGALYCPNGVDEWVSADFAAGDVLTFPSFTVHRALRPVTRERVRLSMDVRYQAVSEPIEQRSLSNHADVDWDTIYADWPAGGLQYYWRDDHPTLSPWDDTLLQPGVRIC